MNLSTSPLSQNTEKLNFWFQSNEFYRLFVLGLISLLMCTVVPLSVMAPVPLVIASLLFGKLRGFLLSVGTAIFLVTLNLASFYFPQLFGTLLSQIAGETLVIYLTSVLYAYAVLEIILNKREPSAGVVRNGFILMAIFLIGLGLVSHFAHFSILDYFRQETVALITKFKAENVELLSGAGEEVRELQAYLENPDKILAWLPVLFVIGLFLGLWISLFIVLRSLPIWRHKEAYPYTMEDLKKFKVSEQMIWPLILALVLFLGSDYGLPKSSEAIGEGLLYCTGLFFFFQGFGILLDFLTYLRIFGIMRSFFIFGILWIGLKYIAILGIFNIWFDFRKFFKTNINNEGDKI